jgi:hypothetical protein
MDGLANWGLLDDLTVKNRVCVLPTTSTYLSPMLSVSDGSEIGVGADG